MSAAFAMWSPSCSKTGVGVQPAFPRRGGHPVLVEGQTRGVREQVTDRRPGGTGGLVQLDGTPPRTRRVPRTPRAAW
ncbi:hypothetical protein LV779_29415 [Streptomyces thinghirensis]|nr:hypothetical protein [Streptomyces thinghirensis]